MRSKIIKQRGDLLAALDIGSTKTCCFIARLENFKSNQGNFDLPKFNILGIGHKASEGVRNGAIVDMEASEVSIRRAVQAAETIAKETIGNVCVNLT